MDTDEDYEMNSSGEDFNHSQHFTEEDLLDSLFLTCDVKKAGVVPVSNLIEYLKFTSSAISEVLYCRYTVFNICLNWR